MSTTEITLSEEQTAQRDTFIDRMLQSTAGVFDIFTVHIGDRLGFYDQLANNGWLTSTGLAQQAGAQERYVHEWLEQQTVSGITDIHARLQENPPARIADIGMGAGWSSIGLAQAYPNVLVDGYDLDEPSVELARNNAREAQLDGRLKFHLRDAADADLAGRYDLVTLFEAVHDMSDPVAALQTARRLLNEDGSVIIVDERVGDEFTESGNDVEWMMYGWSVLHCLPAGMADQPSVGTGTVMRTDTLEKYAQEAGFSEVEVLPIDNFFFRVYRLKL